MWRVVLVVQIFYIFSQWMTEQDKNNIKLSKNIKIQNDPLEKELNEKEIKPDLDVDDNNDSDSLEAFNEKEAVKKFKEAKRTNEQSNFPNILKSLQIANLKETEFMMKKLLITMDELLLEETAKIMKKWHDYIMVDLIEKNFLVLGTIVYIAGNYRRNKLCTV